MLDLHDVSLVNRSNFVTIVSCGIVESELSNPQGVVPCDNLQTFNDTWNTLSTKKEYRSLITIIIVAIYNAPCLSKRHSWCRRDAEASRLTMRYIDLKGHAAFDRASWSMKSVWKPFSMKYVWLERCFWKVDYNDQNKYASTLHGFPYYIVN